MLIITEEDQEVFNRTRRALGDNVYRLRTQMGMTQKDLADVTGLYRNYISEIEIGYRAINLYTLVCLARGLGVSVIDLLKEETNA